MSARELDDLAEIIDTVIATRQYVGPRHLGEPGPDDATLRTLLAAAAAAPDHRRLQPWRFVVLGASARTELADVFERALLERDPGAGDSQRADARDKAARGACLLLAIVDLRDDDPRVHALERVISLGCAIQNLLLAATARGFGSALSSGRALQSAALRDTYALAEHEQAICFVSLGTPERNREPRTRPDPDSFTTWR